jgi:predicted aspartyl protease
MNKHLGVLSVACLLTGALAVRAYALEIPGSNALPAPTSAPASVSDAPAAAVSPAPTAAAAPEEELSEVVISAPEPVYVAPTLRDRIGRIWAPVKINGKGPFRLVLDTGASHSAITPYIVNRLSSTHTGETIPVMLHGVTGSAVVPALKARTMEVGDMLIEQTTLPVVPDAFGGAQGVLGREGLMDKRIFADFSHDKLVIANSRGQRAPPGYKVIPLKLTQAGLLATDVYIGRVRCRAIIDTGAQQTVGNLALLEALMRRAPRDSVDEEIIGVTLDMQHGKYVRVPPVRFGNMQLRNVHVAFGDMPLFELWKFDTSPTLLIGMDVLGLFDQLVIDYKMREMQMRMRDENNGVQISVDPYSSGLGRGS